MEYRTGAALRSALEARLPAYAEALGIPIYQARREVAFNRLLARMLLIDADSWAVKGGMNLAYRVGGRARSTKDIDFSQRGGVEVIKGVIKGATALDMADHFLYRIDGMEELEAGEHGPALVRFKVACELGGRRFESFKLDVGLGEELQAEPEQVGVSAVLDFAGLGGFTIPVLPVEAQAAEKIHAYTRTYGKDGESSSRVKDLVDLVVMAQRTVLRARDLRAALDRVFAQRATHPLPRALPAPPSDWTPRYRKLVETLDVPKTAEEAHQQVAAMLDPVLGGTVRRGRWSQKARSWGPPKL